jgi:hypothetical protein
MRRRDTLNTRKGQQIFINFVKIDNLGPRMIASRTLVKLVSHLLEERQASAGHSRNIVMFILIINIVRKPLAKSAHAIGMAPRTTPAPPDNGLPNSSALI